MQTDFTRTHAALREWHRTEQERLDNYGRHGSLTEFQAIAAAARAIVQDAFYEDTKAYNRQDVCRTVPLDAIVKMTRYSTQGE